MGAEQRAFEEGQTTGRKEGKVRGMRLASTNLKAWAEAARDNEDPTEFRVLTDAAESMTQIADRLEEEG